MTRGAKILGVVVFLLELFVLLYLSLMFLLLLAVVVDQGRYNWRLLTLAAGGYGLVSLWWLLVVAGLPARPGPFRIPAVIMAGLAVGVLLGGYLIASIIAQNGLSMSLQALALFGAPIAISAHLLFRVRRRAK